MFGEDSDALVRRVISAAVVVAVLVQNAACVRLPAQPDKRACEAEKADILSHLKDDPKRAIFFNSENFDFDKNERGWSCAAFVQPGFYRVDVSVLWSDESMERYPNIMGFRIEPGHQYSVGACEVGVGQAPAVATLIYQPTTVTGGTPSSWGGGGLGGGGPLAIVLIPILVVVVVVVGLFKGVSFLVKKATEPSTRPNGYYWIEDVSTGEVVAGVRCPM